MDEELLVTAQSAYGVEHARALLGGRLEARIDPDVLGLRLARVLDSRAQLLRQ